MEKKEKLEMIYHLVQELGLSFQEIEEYFSAKAIGNSSIGQEYKASAKVLPGMYVYADGMISSELIPGRLVKAVVAYIEGKTAYAICLKQVELPWSSDRLDVKASRGMTDGKKATKKILEAARKTGKKAEAAQFCYNYVENGVESGEAFLPSAEEWKKIYANKAAINETLKALGVLLLRGWYWSSTENDTGYAWVFDMNYGSRGYSNKTLNYSYVRPVIILSIE